MEETNLVTENPNDVTVVQDGKENTQQDPLNKVKNKEGNMSSKDDGSYVAFIKSLNSISNTEDKLSLVINKYIHLAGEHKKMQYSKKQNEKSLVMVRKERDSLQEQLNKALLLKSKLENLCRELQKQNKAIKEESLLKIREEEERRKETQTKFQNTLSEISTLLQQNSEKNVKLRDDNINMGEKFKSVVMQYQLREQQVEKLSKQMELESQLADAKLQKANLEMLAEKERHKGEIEAMKVKMAQYIAKIAEQQGTENALRSQLAIYIEKYDEFQGTLAKSNQVFVNFKEQMSLMTKQIKKLEKESQLYKERWQDSHAALVDLWADKQTTLEKFSATTKQLQHMQSLCRTFQAERTILLNTLKEHNIERPPVPTPMPETPTPVMTPSTTNNVDIRVANCAQLRQSLAHLQTHLNVLTNNNEIKQEQAKSSKKTKSKKSKGVKQMSKSDLEKQENANDNASSCIDSGVNQSAEETEEVVPLSSIEPTVDGELSDKTMETLIANVDVDKSFDLIDFGIDRTNASGSKIVMPSEPNQIDVDGYSATSQQNQIRDGDTESIVVEADSVTSDTTEKAPLEITDTEKAPLEIPDTEKAPLEITVTEKAPLEITDTEKAPLVTDTEKVPLEIPDTEKAPLEITVTKKAPLEITDTEKAPLEITVTEKAPLEITDTEKAPLEITVTEKAPLKITDTEKAPLVTDTEKVPLEITDTEKAPLEITDTEKESVLDQP